MEGFLFCLIWKPVDESYDPADNDEELNKKLNENRKIAIQNQEKVMEEFVLKQEEKQANGLTDEDSEADDGDDMNEDSDGDDDDDHESDEDTEPVQVASTSASFDKNRKRSSFESDSDDPTHDKEPIKKARLPQDASVSDDLYNFSILASIRKRSEIVTVEEPRVDADTVQKRNDSDVDDDEVQWL